MVQLPVRNMDWKGSSNMIELKTSRRDYLQTKVLAEQQL